MATNPRYKNGNYRRKLRAKIKAGGGVCYLCGKPIDYSLPKTDPLSFVVDEIIPVSRWREFGYPSPEAVCMDANNTRAAHRICNAQKSNKTINELQNRVKRKQRAFISHDGEW